MTDGLGMLSYEFATHDMLFSALRSLPILAAAATGMRKSNADRRIYDGNASAGQL